MGKVIFKRGVNANYVSNTDALYFSTDTDSTGRYPLYLAGRNYNAGLNIVKCDWTTTDDFVTEATKVLTDSQISSYKKADIINLSASTSGYLFCYRDWENSSTTSIKYIGTFVNGTTVYQYLLTLDVSNKKLLCKKIQTALKSDIPTIDSSLSTTSTNPVQNKVINTALSKKANSGAEETANVIGDLSDTDYDTTFPIVLGGTAGTMDMYDYTGALKAAPIAIQYTGVSGAADVVPTDGTSVSLQDFYQISLKNGSNSATLTPTKITVGTTDLTFGSTTGTIAVTTDLDTKVSKTGDTVTGTLISAGNLVINNKEYETSGDTAGIDTSKGGITFKDPENPSVGVQVLNLTYGGGSLYISDSDPTSTPTVIFKTDSTPTSGSKSIVTSGNLYDALNNSTLTATILNSTKYDVSTLSPNYYTTTSIPQGMTIDVVNGNVPLFGTSKDGTYKGIINVRFKEGGGGQSEFWGGIPELQLAVKKNTIYFRTAEITSGNGWTAWTLLNGEKRKETVSTMVDMNVYPNIYYYCDTSIDELSIANIYDAGGTLIDSFIPGVDSAVCEYTFEFVAASGFTLSLPSDVQWSTIPTFTEGKRYIISIVNNLAVWAQFDS